MSNSEFLKEMGITQWVSRGAPEEVSTSPQASTISEQAATATASAIEAPKRASQGSWIFFGAQPQGDAQALFQNIIRVLGLSPKEWSWKKPADSLGQITSQENNLPVVAFAFGGSVAQKITGERDPLPQLRETVLALNTGNDDEVPVIASFDLSQAVANPKEKSLLWQDLLLARSVLQNI